MLGLEVVLNKLYLEVVVRDEEEEEQEKEEKEKKIGQVARMAGAIVDRQPVPRITLL